MHVPSRPSSVAALRLVALAVTVAAAALASLALGSGSASAGIFCQEPTLTTVCVVPSDLTVNQGSAFQLDVAVDSVENLGAFQFKLKYDPSMIRLANAPCRLVQDIGCSGSFIRSTGRDSNCQQTAPGADEEGIAEFWCVTLGPSPPPGASGSGILYHVHFDAVGPGTTAVELFDVILATPSATVIPSQTEDGSVTVNPATPTATPTPCDENCPTATPTSPPTATPTLALQGAHLSVLPETQLVPAGGTAVVEIFVTDVNNLGAYQFTLNWNSDHLTFVSAENADFLGSTGRSVFCPQPEPLSASVTFGCATFGSDLGPSGAGVLATVTFTTVFPGNTPVDMPIELTRLTDPLGASITVQSSTGAEVNVDEVPSPTPGTPTNTPTLTPTTTPVPFPTTCDTTGTTIVCVQPETQTVTAVGPGERVTAGVVVSEVTDLGAFQFQLNFNPGVVAFDAIHIGSFLGSTGRTVECLPPEITSSSVKLVCTTLGGSPPGPDGSGVLAVVDFTVVGEGTSALGLSNVLLATVGTVTNPSASIPTGTEDGSVTVVLATPTPCPDECPTPTPSPTPTPTLSPTPTPTPDPDAVCPILATATMCVLPQTQTVTAGEDFVVQIVVENVNNLGAYEFTLQFDPIRVGFVSVENSGFLGSTGRTVSCLAPVLELGTVRYACLTIGPSPDGPSGGGVLATVTLHAANVGTSNLALPVIALTDILGEEIPVQGFGGEVVIQ